MVYAAALRIPAKFCRTLDDPADLFGVFIALQNIRCLILKPHILQRVARVNMLAQQIIRKSTIFRHKFMDQIFTVGKLRKYLPLTFPNPCFQCLRISLIKPFCRLVHFTAKVGQDHRFSVGTITIGNRIGIGAVTGRIIALPHGIS